MSEEVERLRTELAAERKRREELERVVEAAREYIHVYPPYSEDGSTPGPPLAAALQNALAALDRGEGEEG